MNGNNRIYFDSFGVEYIPKVGNKNIITNIYRIQAYCSTMCNYFSIEFIDLLIKGTSLVDFTNLFSRDEYEKNDKIIRKYF